MKQVVLIGGGETWPDRDAYLQFLKGMKVDPYEVKSDGWKKNLQLDLGEEYEVLRIGMPTPLNAKYDEWGIWFEKYLPFLREDVVLVGHSLGGSFLVKWLAENRLPAKASSLVLVAAPFVSYDRCEDGLVGFATAGIDNIMESVKDVTLFQSTDDEIVPMENAHLYVQNLEGAKIKEFHADRGHYIFDEHFPELVAHIKHLT